MKTFLKLFIAVAAFTCVTANAAFTSEQKAAAIKIVTDAVATGDKDKVREAVSQQVAQFPELTGDIVAAALSVPGVTPAIQMVVVETAAFTAPYELPAIKVAISNAPGLNDGNRQALNNAAEKGAKDGKQELTGGNTVNTPPPVVSPP